MKNQRVFNFEINMPSVDINYSKVKSRLSSADSDNLVSTPFGLALLDIQGILNVPNDKNAAAECINVDDIYHAVKFGKLIFDEKDKNKVTMIIGNSQRLVGQVVNLQTPLGVLRIPTNTDDNDNDKQIDMVDIIKKKVMFKNRPLPIM